MNYRHVFHAGNKCDVVKHAILTLVLAHLRQKDKGFIVLDSHAGVGLYDLDDPRALKTNEAETGIKSLLAAPAIPALADYTAVLKKLNPSWNGSTENFRTYPGSPLLAFYMLREQDRLIACELHPEDADALRSCAPGAVAVATAETAGAEQSRHKKDNRLQIHHRDGFAALNAFLPPPEKRGLVLIDPPYEQADEFDTVVKHLTEAHKRWPVGIYMIWYPIKDRPAIWQFHDKLASSGIPKILCAEFIYDDAANTDRLNGSGMIIVNPPWKLDEQLNGLFPALHQAMHSAHPATIIKTLAE